MDNRKKHGMTETPEYNCWKALKNRCLNPKNIQYKNYGGRGITVCERWLNFINFYEDMGNRPEGCQIDRIDNNKGYCKENCRWTTNKINNRNRRNNKHHKTQDGLLIQQELIEKIGWFKDQFRWYKNKYGIDWILENYKNNTLPVRVNQSLNKDDLIGKKFNKWTVLSFVRYKRSSGNIYLCKCECGTKKEVIGYHLRVEKSKQCHTCAYNQQINKPNPKKTICNSTS